MERPACPDDIVIRKTSDPYGWMGNMAPYPLLWEGQTYRTSEALFQCLRFDDEAVRAKIRTEASPMRAKWVAKAHADRMVVEQLGAQDVSNMSLVLLLKLKQHPELTRQLLTTGDSYIVEDCTRRARGSGLFWGAALAYGQWRGENQLGLCWMALRSLKDKSGT